jgi:hypothetical protein
VGKVMRRLLVIAFCIIAALSVFVITQEYSVEVQKYLKPGIYVYSDHPAIIDKVEELIRGEKTTQIIWS